MLAWKHVVVQRFVDPRQYQCGGIGQLHLFQLRGYQFDLLPRGRAIFLGVNGAFSIAATSFPLLVGTAVHTLR